MFFNVGGYEILVIAVLALIFIGPEQLPTVMRKVGRYAAQMRSMAQGLREEFMSGLDEMPELKELTNLDNWTGKTDAWLGKGTDADPIVPRGFAERERQREAAALEAAAKPAVERPAERPAPDPQPDGGLNQGAGVAAELVTPADAGPVDAAPVDSAQAPAAEPVGGSPGPEPAPFQPRSGAAEWNRPAPAADEGTGA
ncbi:MAG: Sec-independent protein translocase protein TatB [Acidimicrobiales bacterium]